MRKTLPDSIKYKTISNLTQKICIECKKYFPMDNIHFYKNNSSKDKLNSYCIPCTFKRSRKWVEENPDKYEEQKKRKVENRTEEQKEYIRNYKRREGYCKEWQRNNKDKIKGYQAYREMHKKHEITKYEWLSCKEYFNNSCAYCGLPQEQHFRLHYGEMKNFDLHKEHVDHNGLNDLSNCIPSCQSCNSSKGKHELEHWYNNDNKKFTQERLEKIKEWLNRDYQAYIYESNNSESIN